MPRRPDPLKELLDLQERMNRLFEETLGGDLDERGTVAPAWVPAADVYDKGDAYVLELDLPGLSREDIDIQVKDRELTVRGERHPLGGRSTTFHRLERRYGPFLRSFRFEVDLEADGIEARIVDGLLRIDVPKREQRASSRSVKVSRKGS